MSTITQVFFHELGHFVAREINARYYNKAPIKSFEIFLCNKDIDLYCGKLTIDLINHPEDAHKPTLKNLATYLASSTYGSIFQSLFTGQSLKDSFNNNGQDDYGKWMEALTANKLEDCKSIFIATEEKYFESLSNNSVVNDLLSLNPYDFLRKPSPEAENFYVDIEKLMEKISELIDEHYNTYQELIEEYERLCND